MGLLSAARKLSKVSKTINSMDLPEVDAPVSTNTIVKPEKLNIEADVNFETKEALEMLSNEKSIEAWKTNNKVPKEESKRRKQRKFSKQAKDLQAGIMSGPSYRRYIKENQPATSFSEKDLDTMLPNFKNVVGALTKDKSDKGILGLNNNLEKGSVVTSRLDIPAYNEYNVWVTSIVDKIKGKLYGRTAVLKNVNFDMTNEGAKQLALDIATEKKKTKKVLNKKTKERVSEEYTQTKTPFATMKGEWQDVLDQDAFALAKKYINDPDWIQVGFNPERHSFFYDKATMMPVFEAEEVVQVGALVLAKVKKLNTPELRAARIAKLRKLRITNMPEGSDPTTFNKGGAVTTVELEPFDPKKHKPIDTVGGMKSTEYLVSEESPEGTAWNIPTIWFDKKTKEPVLRTGDDAWNTALEYEEKTGKKFPRYKSIPEAVDAAKKRSSKGGATEKKLDMAEGGAVPMNNQMRMFAEGGLNDEGGMIDEVSGNEVPIGGTKEGVRDDIPANVSEGEFIMPADVVRYHGLDKMMEIRQEAKMGLKKMEAMGQMGNSDEATMDDDMPFGMADLVVVGGSGEPMDFADGGFVPSYAPGGTVTLDTAAVPTTDNTQTTEIDYSAYMDSVTTVVKEYRNAAGETMAITFINGEPTTPVPEGYSLYTPVAGEAGVAPSAAGSVAAVYNSTNNNNNDNEPDINGTGQFAGYRDPNAASVAESINYAGMSDSEFAARMELENGKGYQFGKVLGYAIASMVPGGVTLMYGANRQHTRRSEERLNSMIEGASGPEQARLIVIRDAMLNNSRLKPTDETNSIVQAVDSLLVDKGYSTDVASSASKNSASVVEAQPSLTSTQAANIPIGGKDRFQSLDPIPLTSAQAANIPTGGKGRFQSLDPTQSPPVEVTEVSADNPLGGPQYTAREIEQAAELGMELSNDGSGVRTVDGLVNAELVNVADANARAESEKRRYDNEAANRQMTEAFSYTPPRTTETPDFGIQDVNVRELAAEKRAQDSYSAAVLARREKQIREAREAVDLIRNQNEITSQREADTIIANRQMSEGKYYPPTDARDAFTYFPRTEAEEKAQDDAIATGDAANATMERQLRKYNNEAANRQMTEDFSYTPPPIDPRSRPQTVLGAGNNPPIKRAGKIDAYNDAQLEAFVPSVAETQSSPILSGGPFDNVPRYNPNSLQAAAERAQGNYVPAPVEETNVATTPVDPRDVSRQTGDPLYPVSPTKIDPDASAKMTTLYGTSGDPEGTYFRPTQTQAAFGTVDRYTAPEGSASSGIAPATITDTQLNLAPTTPTTTVRPKARTIPNTRYQDFANRLTPGDGKEYVNNVLVDEDGNRVNNLYQNAANFLTPFDGEEYKKGVIGTTDRSTTSSRSSSSRASIQKNINAKIKAATNSSGEVTWTPEINALVKKRDGSRKERKIGTVNGVPDRIIGADYSREDANRAQGGNSTNPLTKSANYPQTKTNPGGYENNQSDENGPKDKAIVCTEMYRQTELADWQQAMKIWHIYQERYLTIHHQVGYHWLFKPYVKGMKNSSILTKLGSALAKHRTQHLRYVLTKGKAKDDLLGNIWCKFIHPIVYVAGIIKKKVGK